MSNTRNDLVLTCLRAAQQPLGPTEIGRRIGGAAWGNSYGSTPLSPDINHVLKRIKAVRHAGGKYTAPDACG